jgi:oligosaccharide 4-alpha-D-glucosyltransferase
MHKFYLALLLSFCALSSSGQTAGSYVNYEKAGNSLTVRGTLGALKIQVYSPEIFKIQVLESASAVSFDSSYTVSLVPPPVTLTVVENSSSLRLVYEKCTLEISKFPMRVALQSDNAVKIREAGGIDQTRDSVHFSFDINPADVFHGGGGRPFNLDLNKKAFDFYNTQRYAYYDQATGLAQNFNVPFIISSHKYGILFDSDKPGIMRMLLGAYDSTKFNVDALSSGRWAYYLINGDSNDEILENYTLLTGRQPLPPRWAFGYIQSKFGYKTQAEATNAANLIRSSGFPLDALVMDLYWYGDETKMGNFNWDAATWPNPGQMMKDFSSKGVKTILITDPYITTKSSNFRLADSLSLFAKRANTNLTYSFDAWNGTVGLLDIFKPATGSWLRDNYKKLNLQGVTGWWVDKNEPETHPAGASHVNGNAVQIHNLYALAWSKNLYNNFRADFPEKRLFNLTRSGWAGSQRYGALPWSGDVARYWAGLKLQIPIMLQSGMSGLAYMHADVGGFATMSDKTEKDEELDLRWFQFATFTPIVRAHGQRSNVEPYHLNEPFNSVVKKYLNTRYQLLPYLYTLAWKNTTTGRPICLPMDYFEFKKSGEPDDQYYFGENLLVAPVLLHGMLSRKVALPAGKWFDFWTSEIYSGNASIFPKLTVDHIPVYAKAGSFIPMSSKTSIRSTEEYTSDSLTVKFFQDISVPQSSFTLFHDDGADANSLANGKFELIDFSGKVWNDSVRIVTERTKNFDKSLISRAMRYEIKNFNSQLKSVRLNGRSLLVVYREEDFKGESAYYDLSTKQLKIRYQWECALKSTLVIERDGLSLITAVEEIPENELLNVYPNPGRPDQPIQVTAKIPETGNFELEIIDQKGITVYSKSLGKLKKGTLIDSQIDVKNLRGIYIVRLKSPSGKTRAKTILIE